MVTQAGPYVCVSACACASLGRRISPNLSPLDFISYSQIVRRFSNTVTKLETNFQSTVECYSARLTICYNEHWNSPLGTYSFFLGFFPCFCYTFDCPLCVFLLSPIRIFPVFSPKVLGSAQNSPASFSRKCFACWGNWNSWRGLQQ